MQISEYLAEFISFLLLELFWFGVFFAISYVICVFFFRHDLGPFNTILNIIGFIGVIIHELSHYAMCLITGTPAGNISVHYRDPITGRANPHGSVELKEFERLSFLASIFVALAPLMICFWLFIFLLNTTLNSAIDPFLRIISGVLCLSCLIGARPSRIDFKQIPWAFQRDRKNAFYQVLLFLTSTIIVVLITIIYQLFLFSFVYYILIGIVYIIIFYTIRGICYTFSFLGKYKRSNRSSMDYSAYTRKRLKPKRIKDEKPDGLW